MLLMPVKPIANQFRINQSYPWLISLLTSSVIIAYTFWFYYSVLNLGFNSDAFELIFPLHEFGLWRSLAWDGTYHYIPVTVLWLWVQHAFMGLSEPSYQVVNIAQHGVIAILVFGLARELTGKRTLALLAALLFVSSASYYEVVYWSIVGSYYHVSTFFYLVGSITFIRFLVTGHKWQYWLFTACVGLSLFSHELTLSLVPVWVVYYLFVHLPPIDQWQFWQPWLNRRAWLNLGRILVGPAVMLGLFMTVKIIMSFYGDVTGQPQTLNMAIYWFTRSLFATLTFRGDDRFITGELVNFFSGPHRAWLWLVFLTPPITLLFAAWFNRLERFLLLWLLGQLLMTQLAIGISLRHLYLPTIAAAILLVEIGHRLLNLASTPLERQSNRVKYFKTPTLYLAAALLFIAPAYQDLKLAEQLWQNVTAANQSLRTTITEAIRDKEKARTLYIINATRYLIQDGFTTWTFQNGLAKSILINFPNQFTQIHQLYFYADSHNVAKGSRRANLDEIDMSILDKDDYIFVLYLPDEYRFVHVTRSYLAEKGLANLGIQGPVTVYTPESSPSLEWQEGAWPWLNLPVGQELNLPLKNPYQGPLWLAVFYSAQEGRSIEVNVNGQPVGILTAKPNLEPAWLNETLPLPPDQPDTIELKLRSVGVIPGNFARIGLFSPQAAYDAENMSAFFWNGDGSLIVPNGHQLTVPVVNCPQKNCPFFITYLAQPGRNVRLTTEEGQLIEFIPGASENLWRTELFTIEAADVMVITVEATGEAPVQILDFGLGWR